MFLGFIERDCMTTHKTLALLATVSMFGISVSCKNYDTGLSEGMAIGYENGYAAGDQDGFDRAKLYFASADYNSGFTDGKAIGVSQGYSTGYTAGKNDGVVIGYNSGYNVGYNNGYNNGYDDGDYDGYNRGYNNGYDDGYDDGLSDGYDFGYNDGFSDGYDIGYTDGFGDGSFSVGKTEKLQGYANLLSMAHNDMFDYSKIPAPKVTARGIVANGKLLFEETSLTNKDTLKRAAVVEQYLVVEMAKQVKNKFGLSADRALKVAKASNHFRKYASKRALTNADTNSYFEELTGSDLKTIEAAYRSGNMQSILETAAEKNGISPEKMAEVIAKNFL